MELAALSSAMRVRLTRKHAERIDGVDLRGYEPGDVFDLPKAEADLLLAEQWAVPERRERVTASAPHRPVARSPWKAA